MKFHKTYSTQAFCYFQNYHVFQVNGVGLIYPTYLTSEEKIMQNLTSTLIGIAL
jgi:hypothetical protein